MVLSKLKILIIFTALVYYVLMNFETITHGGGRNESIESIKNDSLYLLVSEDGGSFKIGISNNVSSRIATLKGNGNNFDLERSVIFVSNEVRMKSVERTLHFLFQEHNLEIGANFDGYTEWFDISCFDAVVAQIEQIAVLKGIDVKSVKGTELRIPSIRVNSLEQNGSESINQTEIQRLESNNGNTSDLLHALKTSLSKSELQYISGDDIESGSLEISTKVKNRDALIDLLNNANLRFRNGRIWIFPSSSLTSNGDVISGSIKVADDLFEKVECYSECAELCKTLKDFLNHYRTVD